MKSILLLLLLLSVYSWAQDKTGFKPMVNSTIKFSCDTIGIDKAQSWLTSGNIHLIDSRSSKEYNVSHISNSVLITDYETPDITLQNWSKNDTIIVYCSIGYRSEVCAEKLKSQGYKNVFNLYGGIFSWANHKLPMVNNNRKTTEVHGFNTSWSFWLNTELCNPIIN